MFKEEEGIGNADGNTKEERGMANKSKSNIPQRTSGHKFVANQVSTT
jgi:hypothetical protein